MAWSGKRFCLAWWSRLMDGEVVAMQKTATSCCHGWREWFCLLLANTVAIWDWDGICRKTADTFLSSIRRGRLSWEWLRMHESFLLAWRCPLIRSGLDYQWLGCESECCRPKKSSDEQMTRSDYLENNRNEECHRLIGHVRFSRRCTLHCGCSLFL